MPNPTLPPPPCSGADCSHKRAALYTLGHPSEVGLAELMACAAAATLAGFRIVTLACDDDNPAGTPNLCELMERLAQGDFEAIYGRAGGRDVVIELTDVVADAEAGRRRGGVQ